MVRLILFLLTIAAFAVGLSWLADRPGDLVVHWQGYEVQTSVFRAVVMFAILLGVSVLALSILRQLWQSPATVGHFINRRRHKKGLEALSTGMIAIGAGDKATATRYAIQARKSLPNEPLTHLLRAQAAQLSGDKATARRIFEAMLGSPDTEQLGLRGLFLEAEREGETEAARQFAERALAANPKLGWSAEALFDLQCKQHDWAGALETLAVARRNNQVDRGLAERRRAVLLAAQAQDLEEADPEKALALAQEAHGLAPGLVPAAALAGRLLAAKGSTPKATKIVQRTWSQSPHPDLATVYAYARIGDSPRDRLDRVKQLAALTPNSIEAPIALASAAIEARDFDLARKVLEPLAAEGRMAHRACLLMARIEGEQNGDRGRVREWLARAVTAPRDPAWTADGVVSERWAAVSPVTGQLDAFQWKVPVESLDKGDVIAAKLDELMALGAPAAGVATTVIDAEAEPTAKPAAGGGRPAAAKPAVADAETVVPAEVATAKAAAPAKVAPREAEVVEAEPVTARGDKAAHDARPNAGPLLREATVQVKPTATQTTRGQQTGAPTQPSPASPAATATTSVAAASAPSAAQTAAQPSARGVAAAARAGATAAATSATAAGGNGRGGDKANVAAAPPVTSAVTPGARDKTAAATPAAPGKAAQPSSGPATQRPAGKDAKSQPRIFLPDDPGPGDDDDLPKSPLRSLRAGS